MKQFKISSILLLVSVLLTLTGWVSAQEIPEKGIFFSTEEDFFTGVTPDDGNPIISDGDLLNSRGYVYMRNYALVKRFDIKDDLGLDAADVILERERLVAFSTELDHPRGVFTAGDLLVTNRAIIPNAALLAGFDIPRNLDLGLDAIQFIGKTETIVECLNIISEKGPDFLRENPNALRELLKEFRIDIWFSTEGTGPWPKEPRFLDGDLLSAASGIIVARNSMLLPNTVPAGIQDRGVDFGLDAVMMAERINERKLIRFSTEILYKKIRSAFTDGDVLRMGNGVVIHYYDLTKGFEVKAKFLGLDALSYPR
ncbi:MAG: hypothetical protein PVH61_01925 [Candidatus Aminicenantes bacterium]|jgi:hypothetical protein